MKKICFLLSNLVISNLGIAQLTQSHFFPGQPKRAIVVKADPGSIQTGRNQVWDFSNSTPSGEEMQINYVNPGAEITNVFPGSELALKVLDDTTEVHSVLQKTNGRLEQVGLFAKVNGEESQTIFANPKLVFPAQFTYGNFEMDDYQSLVDLSVSGFNLKIHTSGQVSHKIIADGNIKLPNGENFQNAILVISEDIYSDTVLLDLPGFPSDPEITLTKSKTYNWYKNDNSGNPLLFSISSDSVLAQGQWEENTFAFYLNNLTTSLDQQVSKNGLPFPSLVEKSLFVPMTNTKEKIHKIQVFDSMGKVFTEQALEDSPGTKDLIELELSTLPTGIYYLSKLGSNGADLKPFKFMKI